MLLSRAAQFCVVVSSQTAPSLRQHGLCTLGLSRTMTVLKRGQSTPNIGTQPIGDYRPWLAPLCSLTPRITACVSLPGGGSECLVWAARSRCGQRSEGPLLQHSEPRKLPLVPITRSPCPRTHLMGIRTATDLSYLCRTMISTPHWSAVSAQPALEFCSELTLSVSRCRAGNLPSRSCRGMPS